MKRLLPRLLPLAAVTALAGCAAFAPLIPRQGPDALTDMADVVSSDPGKRESLWLAARNSASTQRPDARTQLHVALLQSVPGHSGYDPAAAEHSLQNLQTGDAPSDVATAARERLAELRAAGNCQTRVEELKKQVTKIVEIERKMNHGEKP